MTVDVLLRLILNVFVKLHFVQESVVMSKLLSSLSEEVSASVPPSVEVKTSQFDIPLTERIYILHYRQGQNPNCQKGFAFVGTFREAVARAKHHCGIMGYRFSMIRPMISDLDDDEKFRENGFTI